MGFGSYDESEQEKHEIDADIDEQGGIDTNEKTHDGVVEFDNGASSEELLSQLAEMKEE